MDVEGGREHGDLRLLAVKGLLEAGVARRDELVLADLNPQHVGGRRECDQDGASRDAARSLAV